ncbi:MAG TPA: low molecular weight protein-tyrosine-phosphatase [Nocardioidaceae bacterium]|nr:low molecular weight protein-tyrosine-phosphatase [Nocardioidaceae bacterium]
MPDHQLLPTPRVPEDEPYRIGVVCLGNICRSPIAAVVLRDRIAKAGLADLVEVDSSGTGDWHVGGPMDRRAAAVLAGSGYDGSAHRAQQFAPRWFGDHDLLLVMDDANLRVVHDLAPDDRAAQRVRMFRAFDPRAVDGDREVPDPYYGGDDGFARVLDIIERTADELAKRLQEQLRPS